MKHLSILLSTALSFGAIIAAPAASAQAHQAAGVQSEPVRKSSGEIVKVDKDAAKVTIKHGPLLNLKMPAMTMTFKVKNAAMLEQIKAGDKVEFVAEKVNGVIIITELEAAK
jgi:Cu/Ag efflux protein CusF